MIGVGKMGLSDIIEKHKKKARRKDRASKQEQKEVLVDGHKEFIDTISKELTRKFIEEANTLGPKENKMRILIEFCEESNTFKIECVSEETKVHTFDKSELEDWIAILEKINNKKIKDDVFVNKWPEIKSSKLEYITNNNMSGYI